MDEFWSGEDSETQHHEMVWSPGEKCVTEVTRIYNSRVDVEGCERREKKSE